MDTGGAKAGIKLVHHLLPLYNPVVVTGGKDVTADGTQRYPRDG